MAFTYAVVGACRAGRSYAAAPHIYRFLLSGFLGFFFFFSILFYKSKWLFFVNFIFDPLFLVVHPPRSCKAILLLYLERSRLKVGKHCNIILILEAFVVFSLT